MERVLVEGRPCPDLSDGEPILIPYVDNLNVEGTDPARVQAVKDQVGFRVHEEMDACTTAQSLGFMIDGENGIIHPIVDRWEKIIKVFECFPMDLRYMVERLRGSLDTQCISVYFVVNCLVPSELYMILPMPCMIAGRSCGLQQSRTPDGALVCLSFVV